MARNIVAYKQTDARWAKIPYTVDGDAHETIGYSGCGPTCAAMVVASWADKAVTPVDMAEYAIATGTRTPDSGTAWEFFGKVAKKYGLDFAQTYKNADARECVASGGVVIASMGPGRWTQGGHYILWYDTVGTEILIQDPNSAASRKARAPIDDMYAQSKCYFCYWHPAHRAIEALSKSGVLTSPVYWHDVIDGERIADRANIGWILRKWADAVK